MIEYIDKRATAEHIDMYAKLLTMGDFRLGMMKAKEILLNQESVDIATSIPIIIRGTDLVPVVRCRDCKYWDNGNLSFECPWDYGRYGSSDEDDFCSYGERKEEQ